MNQGIFLNAAKFQLGKIFVQEMAQTEEAIPLLVDVLQSQPDNIEARLLLAQAYMQLGHNTELFALLNPVTHTNDIDQNIIQALMLVGKALFSDMEYAKALGYFERVVINRPFEANAYFHLANCYFRLKRIAEGKQMLQTFEQRRQEWELLAPLKRMVGDSGETKNLYNDAEYAEVVSMMKNRVSDWSEGKQFNPQSRP